MQKQIVQTKQEPQKKAVRRRACSKLSTQVQDYPYLQTQGIIGNHGALRYYGIIQTKLNIGSPNDRYEQEADRVSKQVMRMPEPQIEEPRISHIEPLCQEYERQHRKSMDGKDFQAKVTSGQTTNVAPEVGTLTQIAQDGGQSLPKPTAKPVRHRLSNIDSPRIQRKRLRNFQDTPLGETESGEIVAKEEIVPPGEKPGKFEGYSSEYHALIAARQGSSVGIVIRDSEGLYHVFSTNLLSHFDMHDPATRIEEKPRGQEIIRWVWPIGQSLSESNWRDQVREAMRLFETYRTASSGQEKKRETTEQAFVTLMVRFLGLHTDEIHIAKSDTDIKAGKVNFNIDLKALGEGGIVELPDTRIGDIPKPVMKIGPFAFDESSPAFLQKTFAHEVEHFVHAKRSIEILEKWREARSKKTFEDWLYDQYKKGSVTRLEYDLAIESIRGGDAVTQAFAFLAGFMATYHVIPLSKAEGILHQIGQIASFFSFYVGSKKELISRLHKYYCGLDLERRQLFDKYIENHRATATGDAEKDFHKLWLKALSKKC